MDSLFQEYRDLIRALPLAKHSFSSNKNNWKIENKHILKFHDEIFSFNEEVTISREDLFNSFDNDPIEMFILKIIYWAYPRGMRGNNLKKLTQNENFDRLVNILLNIKKKPEISTEFIEHALNSIDGIGLSTLSKFLYFSCATFNKKSCLILDQRLIKVFNNMYFVEYNFLRNCKYPYSVDEYIDYIDITDDIAGRMKFGADYLEMFLFVFGNNLKLYPIGEDGFYDDLD